MKAVMISIQKPHTTNIFNATKKGEWRTRPLPKGKAYCYETKNQGNGCGKVIGEFDVVSVVAYSSAARIPPRIIDQGAVSIEFLQKYSKGKALYWCRIANATIYDKPKELRAFYAYKVCKDYYGGNSGCDDVCGVAENNQCRCGHAALTRPPQSWCYVMEG